MKTTQKKRLKIFMKNQDFLDLNIRASGKFQEAKSQEPNKSKIKN
jgi:hypothetical protein